MGNNTKNAYRWCVLVFSVLAMLFAGIIYAWSILKTPFAKEFGWEGDQLALNFTLTMCTFCLGGLLGSFLSNKMGVKLSGLISAVLAGGGMTLTAFLNANNVVMLYLCYAVMAGLGIGIAYNVIIATVSVWFPDKKGFAMGALLMGFGASTLILGSLAEKGFNSKLGFKGTYVVLGAALFAVLAFVSLLLKRPDADTKLPSAKKTSSNSTEDFEKKDYSPIQMLKRFSFWRAFVLLAFATAVGNSVISFARDLAISVEAEESLATALVGVFAVFNGLGRIVTGALFDWLGRKKTMLIATLLLIVAAGTTLLSVIISSLPICIIGLCLIGLSYGTVPIMVSAFILSFYGQKHFATNFSIMNCNLICASFMATACAGMLDSFGSYIAPFVALLTLSVVAFLFNLSLKKP